MIPLPATAGVGKPNTSMANGGTATQRRMSALIDPAKGVARRRRSKVMTLV